MCLLEAMILFMVFISLLLLPSRKVIAGIQKTNIGCRSKVNGLFSGVVRISLSIIIMFMKLKDTHMIYLF